ncbi:MAG: cytochrome c biogenesis protein [bacterium]
MNKSLFRIIFEAATFLLVLLSLYMIFVYVPTEKVMGIVQRIFYFHVSIATITLTAFFLVFVYSVLFLVKRDLKWDIWAQSAAEVGIVFCSLVLITGPIWAKPIWGVWWTWDARLTTTLILWFIYVAYLMLRSSAGTSDLKRARFAAVFGIVGFIDVPVVYFSIHWWRTIHPVVITAHKVRLATPMVYTMLVSLTALGFLFTWLLLERAALGKARHLLDDLKQLSNGVSFK